MTLSILTLCVKGLFATLSINDKHHKDTQSLCWMSGCDVLFIVMLNYCYPEYHAAFRLLFKTVNYSECHFIRQALI
jgi:hypothetical protein